MVTTGGIHALYIACQALLEPGDEVIVPDPEWPPCMGNIKAARGVPVPCRLHEPLGWRYELAELESKITPKTRAIYINSPHNPTGGVLTRQDVEAIAALCRDRSLWLLSDEAYEDVLFDGAEHVSPASLPDMYERTISVFTFSKSYAMTGLRLGYVAARDAKLRERMKKALFYTASNVDVGRAVRRNRRARRAAGSRGGVQAGARGEAGPVLCRDPRARGRRVQRRAAEGGVLRVPAHRSVMAAGAPAIPASRLVGADGIPDFAGHASAAFPGADFGATGEGYIRFCFARDRRELTGALESMAALFGGR